MRDYTKIEAWKLADDLTVAIYERTRGFPREEIYGLTSQVRRASYSVPSNIAEGSARSTQRDYPHFLYIARGSLSETQYFMHPAHRFGYLTDAEHGHLAADAKRVFGCLHGLIQAVEKESGKFARVAASLTSMVVISLATLVSRPVVQ
jgi:four helix bundle protein